MPLIGAVRARDLTTAALAAAIGAKLRNGYVREPHVAVEIEAYRPFFILGEVTAPGQYPYVANMTAETAVAIAGGFTPRACKKTVVISRPATASSTAAKSPSTSRSGPAIPSSSPNDGSEMPAPPDRPLKIIHVMRAAVGGLVPPRARSRARTGRARPSGRHHRRLDHRRGARRRGARGAGAATALGLTRIPMSRNLAWSDLEAVADVCPARARQQRRRAARPRRQGRRLCAPGARHARDPRLHPAWRQPALSLELADRPDLSHRRAAA